MRLAHKIHFKDRFLFSLFMFLEHVFGKRVVDWFFQKQRSALHRRVVQAVKVRPGARLEIDRRSDITPEIFKKEYLRPARPVVLEGWIKDWPCCQRWSPDFFISRYGDDDLIIASPRLDIEISSLRQVADGMKRGSKDYARFSPVLYKHPELQEDLKMEKIFALLSGKQSPRFQLFMGGGGTITPLHAAGWSNLFLQIYGEKRWVLIDPTYTPLIRPPIGRTPYFNSGPELQHLEDEVFDYVDHYEFSLKPGDLLFNPSFIWHYVENLSDSIGVGLRWLEVGNVNRTSPMLGILSLLATNPSMIRLALDKDSSGVIPVFLRRVKSGMIQRNAWGKDP